MSSSERQDRNIYSNRGKAKRAWEAILLSVTEQEAEMSVWKFKKANKSAGFWWETTRRAS